MCTVLVRYLLRPFTRFFLDVLTELPVLSAPRWSRLGRTGRAGKMGVAITFLTNDDDEVMWVMHIVLFLSISDYPFP